MRFAPRLWVLVQVVAFGRTQAEPASPRIILAFDTSASLMGDSCLTGPVVDDTVECPGADVACGTCDVPGCGNGLPDDSVLWQFKRAAALLVSAYGEVGWALSDGNRGLRRRRSGPRLRSGGRVLGRARTGSGGVQLH